MRLSPKLTQKLAWGISWAAGVSTLLILLVIVGYVVTRGLSAIDLEFLLTPPEGGLTAEGGISTVIVSTIYLVGITLVFLTPLGIGAAIYLAEYARDNWLTRLIRYGIELLAGVPSIVFGLFGFLVFVRLLGFGFSILAGALTLVCLLLPFIIRASEEAMKMVPQSYREAALSLGATRWQTIRQVILPAALPGIVTGVILCIGGAVAESAPLFVTMGGSHLMPASPLDQGRPLSLHVFYIATETRAFEVAMATAVVLMVIIVALNGITNWLSRRFQARMRGGI